jgi:hypothetical protein
MANAIKIMGAINSPFAKTKATARPVIKTGKISLTHPQFCLSDMLILIPG